MAYKAKMASTANVKVAYKANVKVAFKAKVMVAYEARTIWHMRQGQSGIQGKGKSGM